MVTKYDPCSTPDHPKLKIVGVWPDYRGHLGGGGYIMDDYQVADEVLSKTLSMTQTRSWTMMDLVMAI